MPSVTATVDRQGLLGHVGAVGLDGRRRRRRGHDLHVDAVRHVQPGVAPLGLDQPDDVAGQALGLELVVDGGVEGDHAHVVGQGPALVDVAGPEHELVLARLEAHAAGDDAVVGVVPIPGSHRGGDTVGCRGRAGVRGRHAPG